MMDGIIFFFEEYLNTELLKFNSKYFLSPGYKRKVVSGVINEREYAKEREKEFFTISNDLIQAYHIKIKQDKSETFLDRWFLDSVRKEIDFLSDEVKKIRDIGIKNVLMVILSGVVRSCRATMHSDLAVLKESVTTTYYCKKHGKICKPYQELVGILFYR